MTIQSSLPFFVSDKYCASPPNLWHTLHWQLICLKPPQVFGRARAFSRHVTPAQLTALECLRKLGTAVHLKFMSNSVLCLTYLFYIPRKG